MSQPLLELETLEPDRPTIAIDGRLYDLALPDDFGLLESARLARLMAQALATEKDVEALADDAPLEARTLESLERILDGTIGMVVRGPAGQRGGLPPDILGRLNSSQKVKVVEAFAGVAGRTAPLPRTQDRSTSGKRSPSSRRRTARRTGTRSPSASSSRTSKRCPT